MSAIEHLRNIIEKMPKESQLYQKNQGILKNQGFEQTLLDLNIVGFGRYRLTGDLIYKDTRYQVTSNFQTIQSMKISAQLAGLLFVDAKDIPHDIMVSVAAKSYKDENKSEVVLTMQKDLKAYGIFKNQVEGIHNFYVTKQGNFMSI